MILCSGRKIDSEMVYSEIAMYKAVHSRCRGCSDDRVGCSVFVIMHLIGLLFRLLGIPMSIHRWSRSGATGVVVCRLVPSRETLV